MSICRFCKNTFNRLNNHQKYCNDTCRKASRQLYLQGGILCVFCKVNKVNRKDRKFCSRSCFIEYKSKEDATKDCELCQKTFIVPKRNKSQKYCTKTCYMNNLKTIGGTSNINRVFNSDLKNTFSLRWEVLWKMRPDLHNIMTRIEQRLPIL